jgi:hypothetical protein
MLEFFFQRHSFFSVMRLIPFFACDIRNKPNGFLLSDVWGWDEDTLEKKHDYIQWLFPDTTKSIFNPDAPIPTAEEIRLIGTDGLLREHYLRGLRVMMRFYGFVFVGGKMVPHARARPCFLNMERKSHNLLRITRMLKSLLLFGFSKGFDVVLQGLKAHLPQSHVATQRAMADYWIPLTASTRTRFEVHKLGHPFLVVKQNASLHLSSSPLCIIKDQKLDQSMTLADFKHMRCIRRTTSKPQDGRCKENKGDIKENVDVLGLENPQAICDTDVSHVLQTLRKSPDEFLVFVYV